MKVRDLGAAALGMAVLCGIHGASAEAFVFESLNLGGGTQLSAVNSSGALLGSNPNYGATFLYQNGAFTTLNDPLGYVTYGSALNDLGAVAGSYVVSTAAGNIAHGFTYFNNVFTTFDVPGADQSYLSGINNLGAVVGTYYDAFGFYGFVESGGVITKLADPLAASPTIPDGINDSGEIVGNYTDSDNLVHGFIYANGVYTTVDAPRDIADAATPPGTALAGINNAGDLVGYYTGGALIPGPSQSFVDVGGVFTILAEPDELSYPGAAPGFNTDVSAISNSGTVVGSYIDQGLDPNSPLYGFIATPVSAPAFIGEPASLLLVCGGLVGAAALRRRFRKDRPIPGAAPG